MVYTIRASTEPTAGEAGSGGGLPHPHRRQARGRWAGDSTWSDGLLQEGYGRWKAENGGQVERVQQQPCLLRQGALGRGAILS